MDHKQSLGRGGRLTELFRNDENFFRVTQKAANGVGLAIPLGNSG
jgi:hypothetical protein